MNSMMSYHAILSSVSVTGALVYFNPFFNPKSVVSYISFTIIVNTENVNYLELISNTENNNVNFGIVKIWTVPSSKFSFPLSNLEIYIFLTSVIIDEATSSNNMDFDVNAGPRSSNLI